MKYKLGQILKKFTTKSGQQAVLRIVKQSDLKTLLNYANNLIAEDTFVMLSGQPMTLKDEQKYLNDSINKIKKEQKIQMVVEVGSKLVGACEVRIFEKRKSHVGEIGISLNKNFRNEGIGTICMQSLIEHARKSGLKLLYLHCFENNHQAINLYKKVGFILSGLVPKMYSYKNDYFGEITMYLPLN